MQKITKLPANHWSLWPREIHAEESMGYSRLNPSIVGVDFWTVNGKCSKIPFKPQYVTGGFYHEHAMFEVSQSPRYPA